MKKSTIVFNIVFIICFGIFIFVSSPNLNPLYSDGLALWGFVIDVYIAVMLSLRGVLHVSNVIGVKFGKREPSVSKPLKSKLAYICVAAAPWVILIVVNIFAIPFFHSARYRDQLTTPETRKFTSDIQPIDVSQLPVVDYDLAQKLADKKLGEKPALGSQVTLGDPTIQKVNGKLEWVVPLEHSGFFKWLSNMSGSAGYIIVSATNPRDVTYVDKYSIKYQPNAYLLDNLQRHARLSGGLFTGLTDYSFELDDSGRPYWVVTTYKNLLGFSMPEADGVLVIDAQNGAAQRYSLNNIPDWVDRVQPQDFIMTQINNRGDYIHGIWNFSNKDKFQASDTSAIIYNNGHCYLYTGITSVGSDESTTGFMFVDMVTKKTYLYDFGGATENAAQTSAEGKVQDLKYNASYPLITNVDGQPTYFMTLKDNAGLIKQYAFVSVTDYTVVGNGETLQEALDNYNVNLRSTSSGKSINTGAKKETVTGTVARFAAENQNGSTVYKFILNNYPDNIYTATYNISDQLALTKEGDSVTVTYDSSSGAIISISSFVNSTLGGN